MKRLHERHGHTANGTVSLTYSAWTNMKHRCRASGPPNYGGRGIRVCHRWRKFTNFLFDMGEAPPGTSIERKDVDADYSPDNCRWATPAEQNNNRRNNRRYLFDGGMHTAAELSRRCGVGAAVLTQRLAYMGWDVERAMSQPKRSYVKHPVGRSK